MALGLIIPLFAGGLLQSCSLDDVLENAACNNDDDCTSNQACIKTLDQKNDDALGRCRGDGACAAGQQSGCAGTEFECLAGGLSFADFEENIYCCDEPGSVIVEVDANDGTADCLSCAQTLCESSEQVCTAEDSLCVIDAASRCGCRPTDIENALCDDDAACGDGFECVRTLEQEAEPSDPQDNAQAIEKGFCRPVEGGVASCDLGTQPGCRSDAGSCGSGTTSSALVDGREYCCVTPDEPALSTALVYEIAGDGSSAACTDCSVLDCPSPTKACTMESDTNCNVTDVCGCTPG